LSTIKEGFYRIGHLRQQLVQILERGFESVFDHDDRPEDGHGTAWNIGVTGGRPGPARVRTG
jgi:hypothetical protein